MSKPKTSSRTIASGTRLTLKVAGQTGHAVCTAGALEAGDFTNWTPAALKAGVSYEPRVPCAIEFLADLMTPQAPDLTVTVAGGSKPPKVWKVSRQDGERQTWQLWILLK